MAQLLEKCCPVKPVRMLLVTHNACGVYDDIDQRLPLWLDQYAEVMEQQHNPEFVAVHMQEVGGSNWKKGGLDLVPRLAEAFAQRFSQYWCTGLLCALQKTEKYTALGCIYLVHRSVAKRVAIWEYAAAAAPEGGAPDAAGAPGGAFRAVSELPSPLVSPPSADARYCDHAQFPLEFFGDGKLSRKGYLLTSWRVDGVPIDLLNVHNVHDASNWVALGDAPDASAPAPSAPPASSVYAERRCACLRHSIEQRAAKMGARGAGASAAALAAAGAVWPCLFVFGDFNFRLTLPKVVEHLCGPGGMAAACALRRTTLAAAAAGDKDPEVALPAKPAADGGDAGVAVMMTAKQFKLSTPQRLLDDHAAFRSLDEELAAYCAGAPAGTALHELPIAFSPSYSYDDAPPGELPAGLRRGSTTADIGESAFSGAASSASDGGLVAAADAAAPVGERALAYQMANAFSTKRCPAWCDRVLMDDAARALVGASAPSAVYGSALQPSVLSDHNAVYLAFEMPRAPSGV